MTHKRINFILIAIIIELLVLILIGGYGIHSSIKKYNKLDSEIAQLKKVNSDQTAETNEYVRSIEFMEKETVKHREFIEQQRLYLIWIIAAIGTIGSVLMGYMGIKSKEDVNNIIKSQYEVAIKESLNSFIGGQPKQKYLQNCIDKNYRAKTKKILFVTIDSEQNLQIKNLINFLENEGYNVENKNKSDKELILNAVNSYDILVNEVTTEEASYKGKEENSNDDFAEKLSLKCNAEKKYCIHFYAGRIESKEATKGYSMPANTVITILERLNNLLYFAPEEL